MTDKTIAVTNLGPIEALTIKLEAPGVTCVSAPNGAGKTILLDALQSVAAGKGKLPLRDGAERGSIEAPGIHTSILPTQTRTAGEFALANLEGKLDISKIVDTGVADPVAADKRRIKALVSLTGVEADPKLFLARPEFAETFDYVAQSDSRKSDDLVEMAAKVARDYQSEARGWEKLAEEDAVKSRALQQQIAAINFAVESDADVLHDRYEQANSAYGKASGRCSAKDAKEKSAENAVQEMASWAERGVSTDFQAAEDRAMYERTLLEETEHTATELRMQIQELQASLQEAERGIEKRQGLLRQAEKEAEAVAHHVGRLAACREVIEDFQAYEAPSPAELEALKETVAQCRRDMEAGVRVRDAHLQQAAYEQVLESAEGRRQRAEKYRQAAAATDDVVSAALQSQVFRIQAVGVHKRLFCFHEAREQWVEYHVLSEGEKWKAAIDGGIERVGQGGLLFIPQEAWEGLDVWNRQLIHQHAQARGVFILTAEATRAPADGREMVAKPYESC